MKRCSREDGGGGSGAAAPFAAAIDASSRIRAICEPGIADADADADTDTDGG
eukprot:CAMPEP_0205956808 /NCGR_PEP_ID=MMETSP1459-20131121/40230_1 /ASSEMBLY_ACC=CAM_ASM_001120 /TAXON_ID=41880 /ORGANISM="Pycnococcus provasolii, Strain RCC931" /LENGTH=51 /DNA_ID=CAMNT_0053329233 /DNA_START=24 /DNA_END=176 /DNA_ORIENTATION=-